MLNLGNFTPFLCLHHKILPLSFVLDVVSNLSGEVVDDKK